MALKIFPESVPVERFLGAFQSHPEAAPEAGRLADDIARIFKLEPMQRDFLERLGEALEGRKTERSLCMGNASLYAPARLKVLRL